MSAIFPLLCYSFVVRNIMKIRVVSALIGFFGVLGFAQQSPSMDLIVQGVDSLNQRNFASSVELLTRAKTIAKEKGNYQEIFLAENNIGLNYFLMNDFAEAMKYYNAAYSIASKYLKDKDRMIVLNNIAILYTKKDEYRQAESYLKQVYQMALKHQDSFRRVAYSINLAQLNLEQNQIEKAFEYIRLAENLEFVDEKLDLDILVAKARAYFLVGDKELSKSIAKEAIFQIELEPRKYTEEHISIVSLLSDIAVAEKNYFKAIEYLDELLLTKPDLESELKLLTKKKEIFKKLQDYRLLGRIQDSIIKKSSELTAANNASLYEAQKVKFEVNSYREALKKEQEEAKAERRLFFLFMGFLILLIILFSWALYYSNLSAKRRKQLIKQNDKIYKLELEKKRSAILHVKNRLRESEKAMEQEQEMLKMKIDSTQRTLSTKALNASGRNELIRRLISDLESSLNGKSNEAIIKESIRDLKQALDCEDEWDSFTEHFEQVKPGFLARLKEGHPNLSSNDIRFISYLYMNLSLKEISVIFNITAETCRKRKERITKKLKLNSSSELYDYLYLI